MCGVDSPDIPGVVCQALIICMTYSVKAVLLLTKLVP